MLIDQAIWDGLLRGAAHGLTYGFSTRLISWLLSGKKKGGTATFPLVKRVQASELGEGIPAGYLLYAASGDGPHLITGKELGSLSADEPLYLVRQGAFSVPARLDDGTAFNLAVEIDAEAGLEGILNEVGEEIDAAAVGAMVAGVLCGVSLGQRPGKPELTHAELQQLATQADVKLRGKGFRCTVASDSAQENEELQWLSEQVKTVHTSQDWQSLVAALQTLLPLDSTAKAELQRMQAEVLQRAVPPEETVSQLAQLTEKAFQRAEIPLDDLRHWRDIAARIDFDEAEDFPDDVALQTTAVAVEKRPGTFWVWSRAEVDARLLRYLQRTVQHAYRGCEKCLARNSDLSLLRQLKPLRDELQQLQELLATTPASTPRFLNSRLSPQVTKELVRQLESHVKTIEQLATRISSLLGRTSLDDDWQADKQHCLHAIDQLSQMLRNRRQVTV